MPIDRLAPARRPPGRPAGFQRWRHLLFLHWRAPLEALQSSVPPPLRLDTFEGRAYVGVVAFTMRDVAPRWAPAVPGISHFHELNVRTYVLHGEVPGVWFYSLDAASSVAVVVARSRWRLPYHRASMRLARAASEVQYESRRLWPGPKPASFEARYRLGAPRGSAAPESLDHFLVERYVLYTSGPGGTLLEGRVHHEPYPLADVALDHAAQTMTSAAGLACEEHAPLVHYSPGVDVDVYALERIGLS